MRISLEAEIAWAQYAAWNLGKLFEIFCKMLHFYPNATERGIMHSET